MLTPWHFDHDSASPLVRKDDDELVTCIDSEFYRGRVTVGWCAVGKNSTCSNTLSIPEAVSACDAWLRAANYELES